MKPIRRYIAALLLIAASAMTCSAQNWLNAPKFYVGVRAGVSVTAESGYGSLFAPQGGVSVNIKVAKIPFYVETGAYYVDRGFKENWDGYSYTAHEHSITVPALISYHIYRTPQFVIQPFMGPVASLAFNGDDTSLALGSRLGVGFSFNQSYYLSLGYDYLPYRSDCGEQLLNTFYLSLGYNF